METLEKRKVNLRKQIKVMLKGMDLNKKSDLDHLICEKIKTIIEELNIKSIYAYMALDWETGTMELVEYLWNNGYRVALPKVFGNTMEFCEAASMDDLEEGAFHILEPNNSCAVVNWKQALVVVPGIAFTCDGNRLGKGGGYYDKYLQKYPEHTTIAPAYEFQILEDLPTDVLDRNVDIVVTEKRIIWCRK